MSCVHARWVLLVCCCCHLWVSFARMSIDCLNWYRLLKANCTCKLYIELQLILPSPVKGRLERGSCKGQAGSRLPWWAQAGAHNLPCYLHTVKWGLPVTSIHSGIGSTTVGLPRTPRPFPWKSIIMQGYMLTPKIPLRPKTSQLQFGQLIWRKMIFFNFFIWTSELHIL